MFEQDDLVQWKVGDLVATGWVSDVVESGRVPDVAVDVHGPAARVQVIRGDRLTDDYVAIPLNMLDRVSVDPMLREKFDIHPPTKSELKLINGLIPSAGRQRDESNTVVIPFVAADNLINRSLDKWDIDSLEKMKRLLPGLPAMLDHDWGDVSKVWGKVFDATYVHAATAPKDAVNASGNGTLNREIVRDEGFGQVVAKVFTNPDSPVLRAVSDGFIGKVSTGGFYFNDYFCPECNVSFMDDSCPHYPPNKAWGMTADKDPSIARYSIRKGLTDMGELSIVTLPNLPNAGVI